jgi:hypothetical protein
MSQVKVDLAVPPFREIAEVIELPNERLGPAEVTPDRLNEMFAGSLLSGGEHAESLNPSNEMDAHPEPVDRLVKPVPVVLTVPARRKWNGSDPPTLIEKPLSAIVRGMQLLADAEPDVFVDPCDRIVRNVVPLTVVSCDVSLCMPATSDWISWSNDVAPGEL